MKALARVVAVTAAASDSDSRACAMITLAALRVTAMHAARYTAAKATDRGGVTIV